MSTQRRVVVLGRFGVSPRDLWDVVIDHEGMSRWAGAEVRVIAGPADGGEGTVRRISMRGLRIDEEVLWAEPPDATGVGRYAYRIVRGLPGLSFHRGEVTVRPWAGGSELWWEVTMDSRIPGVAAAMARLLGPGLNRAVEKLSRQLAER